MYLCVWLVVSFNKLSFLPATKYFVLHYFPIYLSFLNDVSKKVKQATMSSIHELEDNWCHLVPFKRKVDSLSGQTTGQTIKRGDAEKKERDGKSRRSPSLIALLCAMSTGNYLHKRQGALSNPSRGSVVYHEKASDGRKMNRGMRPRLNFAAPVHGGKQNPS